MIFTTAVAGEALLVADVRFFFKFCNENKNKKLFIDLVRWRTTSTINDPVEIKRQSIRLFKKIQRNGR